MGRQGPGRVESGLTTRPSESYSLRGGASESTDPRRRAPVSPSPHSHPHLMILRGSRHPQPITEEVGPQEWGVGESLSCGAGCRGSGPARGRQVLRVDILDPGETLVCLTMVTSVSTFCSLPPPRLHSEESHPVGFGWIGPGGHWGAAASGMRQ